MRIGSPPKSWPSTSLPLLILGALRGISMPAFYVYCLFRPNGEPCYIGKGKGRRAIFHFYPSQQRNPHLSAIVKNAGGVLPHVILHSGLDERTALDYEVA